MEDVYEQTSVIVHHGDPDRFKGLLSIAAVDRIVAERDLGGAALSQVYAPSCAHASAKAG